MAEKDQELKKIIFDPQISEIIKELNQSPASVDSQGIAVRVPEELAELLKRAEASQSSDLLLVAGYPPATRIHGKLTFMNRDPLSAERIKKLAFPLLDVRGRKVFVENHSIDIAFTIVGLGRLRCNLHFQQRSPAAAIRLLPSKVPTLDELNLPRELEAVVESSAGLVLVTGPSGCGKSSTLAALIGILNERSDHHIITIEDPVEYIHPKKNALVEHIEIGSDGLSFYSALRSSLRQDPDVILVGEMRDLDTMRMAITAAETGHLILSTLHTRSAAQTIYRIVDVFPSAQQEQIRVQLSMSLLAVITQQLVPRKDGRGRLPAVEILIATPAVRNLIRKGEIDQTYALQGTQSSLGMRTMERSLAELVRRRQIRKEEAGKRAYYLEEFKKLL